MDRAFIYDVLYALASQGGREAALFGMCGPSAREAFANSLTGDTFPELWFELPLLGDPWLDLHALVSYGDVAGSQPSFAGHDGVYGDALAWFAGLEPNRARQLALSYDSHTGDVEHPAVQVLVSGRDPSVSCAFLEAAGRADLQDGYVRFVHAMPPEWFACYTGVFPGRDAADADPWVRVECIVGDRCQQLYASDPSALRGHLARVGLEEIGDDLVNCVQELACSPFPLEFQFNVGSDGAALPVLSASVRFQPPDWVDPARRAAIDGLLGWLRERGLADERCGLLAQAAFAKRMARGDDLYAILCFPAFVKLRWRAGQPLDAKAYLMARADRGKIS